MCTPRRTTEKYVEFIKRTKGKTTTCCFYLYNNFTLCLCTIQTLWTDLSGHLLAGRSSWTSFGGHFLLDICWWTDPLGHILVEKCSECNNSMILCGCSIQWLPAAISHIWNILSGFLHRFSTCFVLQNLQSSGWIHDVDPIWEYNLHNPPFDIKF